MNKLSATFRGEAATLLQERTHGIDRSYKVKRNTSITCNSSELSTPVCVFLAHITCNSNVGRLMDPTRVALYTVTRPVNTGTPRVYGERQ